MFRSNFRRGGRGLRLKPGEMNKTEAKYYEHLMTLMRDGVIEYVRFDAIKLRLADKTFYSPDFMVMQPDGQIEFHEVKGSRRQRDENGMVTFKPFVEDDAAVKIKVAAGLLPFTFKMVWPTPEGWQSKVY